MNPVREIRTNPRQFAPSFLVVFIAALFGTVIMQGIEILTAWMSSAKIIAESDTAQGLLTMVGLVFFLIALFVSSIVIANTFSIIIAGRSRQLALLRLIGASSTRLRRAASVEGLLVSIPSAIVAFFVSTALALATTSYLGGQITVKPELFTPMMFVPGAATIVVTWFSAYLRARRITGISPIEATSQAVERRPEDVRASMGALTGALILLSMGITLLISGIVSASGNTVSAAGVLLVALGAMLTFIGVIVGNPWILPPLQALTGWVLGRTASSRLAASTIARHPTRNARTVIGLVIGITLMLSVRQRTQEIGLLMALGQTPRRVRGMIVAEGLQLSATACLVAVPLGIAFGWVGALALLSPLTGLFAPSVPWWVIISVVAGSLLAVLAASRGPARAATSISPVEALEAV